MRLFVACELPEKIRESITGIVQNLESDSDRIKWVEKENLHLTMKFIGEVDDVKAEKIKEILSSVRFKPFLTSVAEFGVFPPRGRINVVWMGLSPTEPIEDLHSRIDVSMEKTGFARDTRFQPHITLGRVKRIDDSDAFMKKVSLIKDKFETEPFKVDSFVLKKSVLMPEGPIYTDIKKFMSG
jgi:RNA 2',3'-cyclic 3'-phosphodiesterase